VARGKAEANASCLWAKADPWHEAPRIAGIHPPTPLPLILPLLSLRSVLSSAQGECCEMGEGEGAQGGSERVTPAAIRPPQEKPPGEARGRRVEG